MRPVTLRVTYISLGTDALVTQCEIEFSALWIFVQ